MSFTDSVFEKIIIERNKKVDSAVLGEIQKIAIENGIVTKFILNEKAIVSALEKQIPKKPNIHGYREGREINTISYTCPVCKKHIGRDVFCKYCGQALDWGDSE